MADSILGSREGNGSATPPPPPRRGGPWMGFLHRHRLRVRLARLRARARERTARAQSGLHALWRRQSFWRVVQGLLLGCIVLLLGVCGYVGMGWSLLDSVYMVVITISGVGYGEVRPLRSGPERAHTMLVIVVGMVVVGYTLGRFIQFLTEVELENLMGHRRMRRQIEMLEGHVVVAGYGRVGALVCDELAAAALPFVVIELSHERVNEMEARGFLHVVGDATEESILNAAGLERAKTLVSVMPNDAENVFITLTARQLAPKVMIVARAEQASTSKKLKQAGADHVILPAIIGAHRIVSLLTNPTAVEFAELVTQRSSLAIEMDDVPIQESSTLRGRTLRDADIGRRTGTIVIAVKRNDGRVEFPPSGDDPLNLGDSIVLVGRRSNLDQFRSTFGT